jgi:hypothetical protein
MNMLVSFQPYYSNVLKGEYLTIGIYKGFPNIPGFRGSVNEATTVKSIKLSYQLVGPGRHAYVTTDAKKLEYTPAQVADLALKTYMDLAETQKA